MALATPGLQMAKGARVAAAAVTASATATAPGTASGRARATATARIIQHIRDRILEDLVLFSMARFSPCDSGSTGFLHMTSLKGGG